MGRGRRERRRVQGCVRGGEGDGKGRQREFGERGDEIGLCVSKEGGRHGERGHREKGEHGGRGGRHGERGQREHEGGSTES